MRSAMHRSLAAAEFPGRQQVAASDGCIALRIHAPYNFPVHRDLFTSAAAEFPGQQQVVASDRCIAAPPPCTLQNPGSSSLVQGSPGQARRLRTGDAGVAAEVRYSLGAEEVFIQ